MRILQIHNAYRQRGGEDVQVELEGEALRAAGHEVTTILERNPAGGAASILALVKAPHNRSAARRAIAGALDPPPDLAHVHNTWFRLTPALPELLVKRGIPTVVTLHNFRLLCIQGSLQRDGGPCLDCVGSSPLSGIRHRCYRDSFAASVPAAATISLGRARRSWEGVDRMIVPSESMKTTLASSGFAPARISVVANLVPDPGPRPAPPSDSCTVLFVGRVSEEKGAATAIEAWSRIPAGSGLELEVIGDGPLLERFRQLDTPGVHLTGWKDLHEVREAMLGARAMVFPTLCMESFGRVAAEAFAAGLPVVGSALGAAGEIVGEQGQEWLVEAGDTDAWATAITELVADDALVDAAGRRGRRRYETAYAFEAVRDGLTEVYREVAVE